MAAPTHAAPRDVGGRGPAPAAKVLSVSTAACQSSVPGQGPHALEQKGGVRADSGRAPGSGKPHLQKLLMPELEKPASERG